jgi:hypothetical protein
MAMIVGILGGAALVTWLNAGRRRSAANQSGVFDMGSIDIDDDTSAEIIKRARPALERAREFAG